MWFRPGQMDTDRFRVSSFKNRMRRLKSPVKIETASNDEIEEDSDENETVKVDDDNIVVQRSPSGRRLSKSEKDKLLLTDRKFKNNRVVKSSSKGKITDLEKRDSLKGRNNRKISAPPVLDTVEATATVIVAPKKNVRSHSNLNLNALLRYRLSNKKLSHAEIDRMRRKSITSSSTKADKHKKNDVVDVDKTDRSDVDSCVNGNDDDEGEVFHSCEEPEIHKKTSPSLGARVAAHFNEQKTKKNKKKRKNSRVSLHSQSSFGKFPQSINFKFLMFNTVEKKNGFLPQINNFPFFFYF